MRSVAAGGPGTTGRVTPSPSTDAAALAAALRSALAASIVDLPVVLHVEHVSVIFGTKLSAAREAITSGKCGPFSRVGRRLLVRRESFLEALKAAEVQPRPRVVALGRTGIGRALTAGRGRRRTS